MTAATRVLALAALAGVALAWPPEVPERRPPWADEWVPIDAPPGSRRGPWGGEWVAGDGPRKPVYPTNPWGNEWGPGWRGWYSPPPRPRRDHNTAAVDILRSIISAAENGAELHSHKRYEHMGPYVGPNGLLPPVVYPTLYPTSFDTVAHTQLEQLIINRLLKFRDQMNHSQTELGLPPLDPYRLEQFAFQMHNNTIEVSGSLNNMMAQGLSKFDLEKFKLYLVQGLAVLTITVSNVELQADYTISKGSWFSPVHIPFHGTGRVSLAFGPVNTTVRAKVAVRDKKLAMEALSIQYGFGDVKCTITHESQQGTFGENPGLEQVLSRLVRELLPRVGREWRPALEKRIALRLDEELKKLEWKDIINKIPHN